MDKLPDQHPDSTKDRTDLPVLERLGLSNEDLESLRQQGFVRLETRGGKTRSRLCYRLRGRQYSRYIPAHITVAVTAELWLLQEQLRARRAMAKLAPLARRMLREHKELLRPFLLEHGHYRHGHQLRRRRAKKVVGLVDDTN